jgi:hypothetical protein
MAKNTLFQTRIPSTPLEQNPVNHPQHALLTAIWLNGRAKLCSPGVHQHAIGS